MSRSWVGLVVRCRRALTSLVLVLLVLGVFAGGASADGRGVSVSVGDGYACAVETDGTPVCWGSNDRGQTNVRVDGGTVTQISAGLDHTCVIKTDTIPVCVGSNYYGELNGASHVGPVTEISAGRYHTCAIKPDGTVVDIAGAAEPFRAGTPVCWGSNEYRQAMGEATYVHPYSGPRDCPPSSCAVPYFGAVIQISAGGYHTCAIKTDGYPVCWGDTSHGVATIPAGVGRVIQISAGGSQSAGAQGNHTCAVKTDGAPVCWGSNEFGETNIPAGIGTVTQISAGVYHTCAVKTDGTPVCWGLNLDGQASVPVGIGKVHQISAGGQNTCAVSAARTAGIVCWGYGYHGQTLVPAGVGPDVTPPGPPSHLSTDPASPSQSTTPKVKGIAEDGSLVKVYTTSDCSGTQVATQYASLFGSTGLQVNFAVPVGSTVTYYATATDEAGNTSACSTDHATYIQDSAKPDAPSNLSTDPASPGQSTTPRVKGTAEDGSIVNVYTTSDCSGTPVATQYASMFGSPGLQVNFAVPVASTTTYYATATDQAGNTSACSSDHADYTQDSAKPDAPSGLSTDPASPGQSLTPGVKGTAEAGSSVNVYETSDCSGTAVATGPASDFGSTGLQVAAGPVGSTVTYYATATDEAGNTSRCSSDHADYAVGCAVPTLRGTTLARARVLLRRAHCALGKVTQPRVRTGSMPPRLVVVSQSPAARSVRPAGTKVAVRLGRAASPGLGGEGPTTTPRGPRVFCVHRPLCRGQAVSSVPAAMRAAARAGAGRDLILVGPGRFAASVSDSAHNPVRLVGAGRRTVLVPSRADPAVCRVTFEHGSVVSDLSLRGSLCLAHGTADRLGITTAGEVSLGDGARLRHSAVRSGVGVRGTGGSSLVEDSSITAPSGVVGQGASRSGDDSFVTVRRVRISASRVGVQNVRSVSDSLIRIRGRATGIRADFTGPLTGGAVTLDATNVTVVGDGSAGSTGARSDTAAEAYDGVFSDQPVRLQLTSSIVRGVDVSLREYRGGHDCNFERYKTDCPPGTRSHNVLTASYSDYDPARVKNDRPVSVDGGHNVNVDPRFVNARGGDFHLRFDSPLLGIGARSRPAGLGDRDLGGNRRVVDADHDGSPDIDTGAYEYQGGGPRAVIGVSQTQPYAHSAVRFDASRSTSPDGGPLSYRWEFGDGTAATGRRVTHEYTTAGVHRAYLTVTDYKGDKSFTSRAIRVRPRPKLCGHRC